MHVPQAMDVKYNMPCTYKGWVGILSGARALDVRLFGEAPVHNVHYLAAYVAPAAGCAKRTNNAHYVK